MKRVCMFLFAVLAACSGRGPVAATQVGAALVVHPASTFSVHFADPCHIVFPDGAFLRWETTIAVIGPRGGVLDSVATSIRDETLGVVLTEYQFGAGLILGQLGTNRIEAGRSVVVRNQTVIGTCVPEDYTRHRFVLTVRAQFTDDDGTRHEVTAGPGATGPVP
jgi:hypothetical protein